MLYENVYVSEIWGKNQESLSVVKKRQKKRGYMKRWRIIFKVRGENLGEDGKKGQKTGKGQK